MVKPTKPHASFYPVVVIQDRYQGTYSNGGWIAIRNADELIDERPRSVWLVEDGPGGNDVIAAMFWNSPPKWLAVGATPDAAVAALLEAMPVVEP